MQLDGEML